MGTLIIFPSQKTQKSTEEKALELLGHYTWKNYTEVTGRFLQLILKERISERRIEAALLQTHYPLKDQDFIHGLQWQRSRYTCDGWEEPFGLIAGCGEDARQLITIIGRITGGKIF